MIVEKNVKMSKNTLETIEGLSDFIIVCREALKDGFQYGDDIPDIVSSALSDLIPILDNLDDIASEFSEDPAAFAQAISYGVISLAKGVAWKK